MAAPVSTRVSIVSLPMDKWNSRRHPSAVLNQNVLCNLALPLCQFLDDCRRCDGCWRHSTFLWLQLQWPQIGEPLWYGKILYIVDGRSQQRRNSPVLTRVRHLWRLDWLGLPVLVLVVARFCLSDVFFLAVSSWPLSSRHQWQFSQNMPPGRKIVSSYRPTRGHTYPWRSCTDKCSSLSPATSVVIALRLSLIWVLLKVIYHPLYSMNKFVTNKSNESKLSQDGAQVFFYMGWLASMWPSERVTW